MRPIASLVAALSGLAVLLTACAAPPATTTQAGQPQAQTGAPKRMTAAILGEPHTLSQAVNTAGTGSIRGVGEVEKMIHAGVTALNGRGERVPVLAEQAATVENGLWKVNSDGTMETRWTLRPDARWQDGMPVTAEDLVFTARVSRDESLAFPTGSGYRAIDSVEASDARTVVVKWRRPFIEADELFSYGFMLPLPKHLLEAPYTTNKETLLDQPYWTTAFIGAGPYRVHEFQRSIQMEMRAFDGFVQGKPKIDSVLVKFLQDPNILVANLLAGELDLTMGRGLSLDQALEMNQRWSGRMEAALGSWVAHYPQHLTPDPPVLKEVNFRRALLHTMDRQTISDELTGGRAPVAHSNLGPTSAHYAAVKANVVEHNYDPRRAAQLIEGFGYQKRADGLYYDAQGQKLVIESRTNAGDDFKDKMLLSTADHWKRAGVDITVNIVPRQRASDREYRATYPGFDLVRQPWDPSRFLTEESPLPENNWSGNNRTRYSHLELDTLINRYFTTIPLAERRDVIGRIVRIQTEQAVALGVIYDVGPILIGPRLVNVAENLAEGVDETWNAHQWDLK